MTCFSCPSAYGEANRKRSCQVHAVWGRLGKHMICNILQKGMVGGEGVACLKLCENERDAELSQQGFGKVRLVRGEGRGCLLPGDGGLFKALRTQSRSYSYLSIRKWIFAKISGFILAGQSRTCSRVHRQLARITRIGSMQTEEHSAGPLLRRKPAGVQFVLYIAHWSIFAGP